MEKIIENINISKMNLANFYFYIFKTNYSN